MTPIDIQVSRSKVSVEGQKPILYMLGKGGISVLQTAIFWWYVSNNIGLGHQLMRLVIEVVCMVITPNRPDFRLDSVRRMNEN